MAGLGVNLARTQYCLREIRISQRSGPYLRLQAETRVLAIRLARETDAIIGHRVARIELNTRLCRRNVKANAGTRALHRRTWTQWPPRRREAEIAVILDLMAVLLEANRAKLPEIIGRSLDRQ